MKKFFFFCFLWSTISWSQQSFKPAVVGKNQFVSYEQDKDGNRVRGKVLEVIETVGDKGDKQIQVKVLTSTYEEVDLTPPEIATLRYSLNSENEFLLLSSLEERDQLCFLTPKDVIDDYIKDHSKILLRDAKKVLTHLNRQIMANESSRAVGLLTDDGLKVHGRILDICVTGDSDDQLQREMRIMQLHPQMKLWKITSQDSMFDSITKSESACQRYQNVVKQILDPVRLVTQEKHVGKRTFVMLDRIEKELNPLISKITNQTLVKVNGENYEVLSGKTKDFSTKRILSVGGGVMGREVIQHDPLGTLGLVEKYGQYLAEISHYKNPEPSIIFKTLVNFLSTKVFFQKASSSKLEEWIQEWSEKNKDKGEKFIQSQSLGKAPLNPIEDFLRNGLGVCRHHALVAAYFIDRLIKLGILPPGKVHHVRNRLDSGGAHAWVVYTSDDKTQNWHVDTLWKVVRDQLDGPATKDYLISRGYGKKAIGDEINRFIK